MVNHVKTNLDGMFTFDNVQIFSVPLQSMLKDIESYCNFWKLNLKMLIKTKLVTFLRMADQQVIIYLYGKKREIVPSF